MAHDPPVAAGTFTRSVLVIFSISIIGLVAYWAFGSSRSDWKPGPRFHASGSEWQSLDLEWSELDGKRAADMIVVPVRASVGDGRHEVDLDLLVSLCSGFVWRAQLEDGTPVQRRDFYRVGLRFLLNDSGEMSEPLPVAVVDGACTAMVHEDKIYWNYPGKLVGWSPVGLEKSRKGDPPEFIVTFYRLGDGAGDLDDFDPILACNSLFADTPPDFAAAIDEPTTLRLGARVETGSSLLSFHLGRTWDLVVSGRTCIAEDATAL